MTYLILTSQQWCAVATPLMWRENNDIMTWYLRTKYHVYFLAMSLFLWRRVPAVGCYNDEEVWCRLLLGILGRYKIYRRRVIVFKLKLKLCLYIFDHMQFDWIGFLLCQMHHFWHILVSDNLLLPLSMRSTNCMTHTIHLCIDSCLGFNAWVFPYIQSPWLLCSSILH